MKRYRQSLSEKKKRELDGAILERVLSLDEYKKADIVLTYASMPVEVDTFGLIRAALSDGKKVACPRCVPGTRNMEFYYISGEDELFPGSFSVPEPLPDERNLYTGGENSVCIVPGLSFDYEGFRLGYGKGYYDRFLSGFSGKNIGICYNECVCRRLPHGKYDRAVNVLVSELFIKKITG